jgi:EpsI family protein
MIAKVIVAVLFIGLNYYAYHNFASQDVIPERELFESFPDEIGAWSCRQRQPMGQDVIDNLGVTDYLICVFENKETHEWVDFYAGYHASQQRSDSGKTSLIHPPEHCLPGSGWDIIESSIVKVDYGIPGEAKRVVIAKGKARRLVYFWYQSRGHVIAGNFDRMKHMFIDRALEGRTDGSLIRFTTPIRRGDNAEAEARVEGFAAAILPLLSPHVPN